MATLPSGVDYVTLQRNLQRWVVASSGLPTNKVYWGGQTSPTGQTMPRPTAPAIELRLSNDAEMSKAWVDMESNPLTFADITVTAVNTGTSTVTAVGHGLLTGDGPVRVSGTLPSPIVAGTNYWIIAVDADHLQFASTYVNTGGGQGSTNPITPMTLTSSPAGTFVVSNTSSTVRAGEELMAITRSYERMTFEMHCYSAAGTGLNMATAILQRVRSRRMWPSQRAAFKAANIGILFVERVRAIQGVKDAVLFEPRAYLDMQLCVPCEDAEAITVINRIEITSAEFGLDTLVDTGD